MEDSGTIFPQLVDEAWKEHCRITDRIPLFGIHTIVQYNTDTCSVNRSPERNTHLSHNYNEAPDRSYVVYSLSRLMTVVTCRTLSHDVCVHPNQGVLISCDRIKKWNWCETSICTHESVPASFWFEGIQDPTAAGDAPIRSVTSAPDTSCMVADSVRPSCCESVKMIFLSTVRVMYERRTFDRGHRVSALSSCHKVSGAVSQYRTRCLLSPDLRL
ncbi:hypothetical protein BJY52DRAFT_225152 [Lactarius psammicola]|nr:hypothetical protein BJY52DRAFT_225152 [Lactarius psammicola]